MQGLSRSTLQHCEALIVIVGDGCAFDLADTADADLTAAIDQGSNVWQGTPRACRLCRFAQMELGSACEMPRQQLLNAIDRMVTDAFDDVADTPRDPNC